MTYTDRFKNVLAACLEELETGRATPATLAARYAEYPDLGALLALAAELWALPLPEPDPTRTAAAALRVRQVVERHGDLYVVQPAPGDDAPSLTVPQAAEQAALQRRRHTRVPVLLEGHLWLVQLDGSRHGPSVPITIVDVSSGGMGFRTKEGLQPGAAVEIELRLPERPGPREGQEFTSLLSVFAQRRPDLFQPAAADPSQPGRPAPHHAARAAVLGALARVVHCRSQVELPLLGRHESPYRAGVEFLELRDALASSRL